VADGEVAHGRGVEASGVDWPRAWRPQALTGLGRRPGSAP